MWYHSTLELQQQDNQHLHARIHREENGIPIRTTLQEMVHSQPPTPIHCDNSTATGIVNNSIENKCPRAMDMQYHWLVDQVQQINYDI